MQFEEFLEDITSRSTRNSYLTTMYLLIDSVIGRERDHMIDEGEKKVYLDLIQGYLDEKDRNFLADLNKFRQKLDDKAPRTVRAYLYNAKNVIEICNGYTFDKTKTRRFKELLKGTRKSITKDAVLTHDIIRKIVSHANIPAKAAILIMATSGLRIGELIKIKMEDVDLEKRIIHIPAKIAKTKEERVTFFTSEAEEALQTWIRYRLVYMEQIKKQCVQIKPKYKLDDQRVFPISDTGLREAIHNAVRNAGLMKIDSNTRRITISPHSFRKWFSTTAKNVMNADDVEVLMGHELPYGGAYHRKTDEDLLKEYIKNEQVLFIGSDEAVRTTLENVGVDMMQLRSENLALRDEMGKMKEMIIKLAMDGRIVDGVKDQNMK